MIRGKDGLRFSKEMMKKGEIGMEKSYQKELTGYPSIDKPWLKYYSEEAINALLPSGSMYSYLYENNCQYLNDTAIMYFGTNISYKKLFGQIDRVTEAFKAIGVKRGDTVLFITLSTPEIIYSLYAINRIGARCEFINVLSSSEEIRKYIENAKCKIVVCLDLFVKKVHAAVGDETVNKVIMCSLGASMPFLKQKIFKWKTRSQAVHPNSSIYVSWDIFIANQQGDINYSNDEKDIAIIAHTGGTTGKPKNVLLTNRAINAIALQYKTAYTYQRQQVALDIMVPQTVYGISVNIHMPLCLGMRLAIIPKFTAKDWDKYIKWYKPNHIAGAPPHITSFLSHPNLNVSSFITIAYGGEGISEGTVERLNVYLREHGFSAKITMGYGLSETAAAAFMEYNDCNRTDSVGIPLPKNNVMIWDEQNGTECTYETVGEICVCGPGVMDGYENDSTATGKALQRHSDGKTWLHTGDMGYVDRDGFLYIVGRIKRIVLTCKDGVTIKIFPEQVERILATNEAVKDVCTIGINDAECVNAIVAYIVLNPEYKDREAEVKKQLENLCKRELSEASQPIDYIFRDSLPLSLTGKVDYRALEELVSGEHNMSLV